MPMAVLPPGTLLQILYLRERLALVRPGRFIEIGPGSGELTKVLLERGWSGVSYDLDVNTIAALKARFATEIAQGRYAAIAGDFLSSTPDHNPADLVISCMVMEHLDDVAEPAFMRQAARNLNPGGLMIGLVPSSPAHWGIEDDIAGHCRRYTSDTLNRLMQTTGWQLDHVAGLTYPVSNMLLPVSNFLVNRSERAKLTLSALDRTKQSGRRNVRFKTHFPSIIGLILNEYTMMPFHLLQKCFSKSQRALVLYFEASPPKQEAIS